MRELTVNLGERSYTIFINNGLLAESAGYVSGQIRSKSVLLVSNTTVFPLYGRALANSLAARGLDVLISLIPDGEEFKNMEEAMKVLDIAVHNRLERSSILVALGGGVVGDLAGFAASIYQRGIDFIQIPTTLLSQVDSSVGGKVAVNHPGGKNLIGAFHQPRMVLIDPATLKTLADREYRSGLGEIVKYGIVYDRDFFNFMETNAEEICSQNLTCIEEMIFRSCQIKSVIVEQDEKEWGLRSILNLGHTFGHSLEKLGNYKSFRHGEAVAMGVIAAAMLAWDKGLLAKEDLDRITGLFKRLGLPTLFPSFDPDAVYQGMLNDKKVKNAKLKIILPLGIGDYVIADDPGKPAIVKAIIRAQHKWT